SLASLVASGRSGMVSVTMSSSMLEWARRGMAGPESTGWVAQASTSGAPAPRTASAAAESVPAVSTMSSTMTATRPSTSPMICISATSFGRARRVGRDDGHVAPPDPPAEVLEQHGGGVDVVDRHVEEALDLAGVQVDRQHARGAGGGDQVGHQLGADRHPRRDLPVLAGVAVV